MDQEIIESFSKEKAAGWLQDYAYEAKLVQHYEQADNPKWGLAIQTKGSRSKITTPGYIALIKTYVATHEGKHDELKEFCVNLENNFHYLQSYENAGNIAERENVHKEFAAQILQKLDNKGTAYISYGSENHANFLKFSKENDQYYATFYNAGDYINAEQKQTQKVSGTFVHPAVKYQLKSEYGIQKILEELALESFGMSNKKITENNKKRFSSPVVGSDKIVQDQRIGNCTTRSIREALRGHIPESELREFFTFIHTPYSDMASSVGLDPATLSRIPQYDVPITAQEFTKIVETKIKNKFALPTGWAGKLTDDDLRPFKSAAQIDFVSNILVRDLYEERINSVPKFLELFTLMDYYDQGFNIAGKEKLLDRMSKEFAIDSQTTKEETSKKLWRKMFAASLEDNDLPLTPALLEPVQKKLMNIMEKRNYALDDNNFQEILTDWRVGCLNDDAFCTIPSRLDNILEDFQTGCTSDFLLPGKTCVLVKAPILKGLIDDNKEKFTQLSKTKLPSKDKNGVVLEDNVIDYYNILQRAQTARSTAGYKQQEHFSQEKFDNLYDKAKDYSLSKEQAFAKYLEEYTKDIDIDSIRGSNFQNNKKIIGSKQANVEKERQRRRQQANHTESISR
jgi:hypothetical protein